MNTIDVTVCGGGAVGASLALALARIGLQVTLESRPPSSAADIRAYALNAESRALLRSLKVWDALPEDAVTPVYDMHVQGDVAPAAIEFSAWTQRVEALAWIIDAAELDRALEVALRFSPNVRRVEPGAEPTPAALLVLAEGKHSATRERLGVQMVRHGYGQTAIAARLIADRPHGHVARQWFGSPDVLGLLPFDRPRAACSWSLVWSLPDARAHELLAASPGDFEQALMRATGGDVGGLSLVGERAAWPLSLARARQMVGPGWVLVGDAAHVVHPLAGQGLNLGLADVVALARVLAARESWRALGDVALLRRYARERAAAILAMGTLTDSLLHLFAHPAGPVRELRNRGLTLLNHLAPIKRALVARATGASTSGTP